MTTDKEPLNIEDLLAENDAGVCHWRVSGDTPMTDRPKRRTYKSVYKPEDFERLHFEKLPERSTSEAPHCQEGWVAMPGTLTVEICGRAYMSDEDIRRVEEYDGPVVLGQPEGPMRDRYGRPIQAAPWKQLDFGGDPFPMELFDLMEMLPYGDDEETKK